MPAAMPAIMTEHLSCSPQQLILNALFDAEPLSWPDAQVLLDCALDALHELSLQG